MGKTLEELGDLLDAPLPDPVVAESRKSADWAAFLEQIEDLQNGGQANWASDTLEGIYESVRKSGIVTEGQRRAVGNIEEAANRPRYRRRRW